MPIACMFGHQWSDWVQTGPCSRERRCTRKDCGKVETETKHDLQFDHYDENCYKVSICSRCQKTERGQKAHDWGNYQYYEENCCTMRSICARCGSVRYKEDCHKTKEINPEQKCEIHSVCERCGETEISSRPHEWNTSGIKTYEECMEYAIHQYEYRIKESETIAKSEMIESTDKIKQNWRVESLSEKLSNLKAKKAGFSNGGGDDPARVCKTCLFIQKTGRRPERVSTQDQEK